MALLNYKLAHFRNMALIMEVVKLQSRASSTANHQNKEEFLQLELFPKAYFRLKKRERKEFSLLPSKPPSSAMMPVNVDWPSVWPAPRSFHPATVPLPVRMGYPAKRKPIPDKWGNTELMKIPNFLHLTPPAVQRHCAAIRKFCTPWPEGVSWPSAITATSKEPDAHREQLQFLVNPKPVDICVQEVKEKYGYFGGDTSNTDNSRKLKQKNVLEFSPNAEEAYSDPGYFPMMVERSTYFYSGPSIRDPRARVAAIKVRLEDLFLVEHSVDKLLRLVGGRYDRKSNTVTITADRCPMYRQNLEYCYYLLTVIRAESESVEPWEHEKERSDHAFFEYTGSGCEKAVKEMIRLKQEKHLPVPTEQQIQQLKIALDTIHNIDENEQTLKKYGEAVMSLYGLPTFLHDEASTHNTLVLESAHLDLPPVQTDSYFDKHRVKWLLIYGRTGGQQELPWEWTGGYKYLERPVRKHPAYRFPVHGIHAEGPDPLI